MARRTHGVASETVPVDRRTGHAGEHHAGLDLSRIVFDVVNHDLAGICVDDVGCGRDDPVEAGHPSTPVPPSGSSARESPTSGVVVTVLTGARTGPSSATTEASEATRSWRAV